MAGRTNQDLPGQEPEDAADDTNAEEQSAVDQQLSPGDANRQVVHRVLENAWAGNDDGLRQDDADEPENEIPPVPEHVGKKPPEG